MSSRFNIRNMLPNNYYTTKIYRDPSTGRFTKKTKRNIFRSSVIKPGPALTNNRDENGRFA